MELKCTLSNYCSNKQIKVFVVFRLPHFQNRFEVNFWVGIDNELMGPITIVDKRKHTYCWVYDQRLDDCYNVPSCQHDIEYRRCSYWKFILDIKDFLFKFLLYSIHWKNAKRFHNFVKIVIAKNVFRNILILRHLVKNTE